MTKIDAAKKKFLAGDYIAARDAYIEAGKLIGAGLVQANITIAERRARRLRVGGQNSHARINILFITDEQYVLPTCVAINSLIENKNQESVYDIKVICLNLHDKKISEFQRLKREKADIQTISLSANLSHFMINKKGFHVSPAATLKFQVADIFPDLERIIYCDGDIVFQDDISELNSLNLDNKYAAVVADIKTTRRYKPTMLAKLGIAHHREYFNSGVMLLNLDRMRRENIAADLVSYRTHGKNFFMDQDAFNVVFRDQVHLVSPSYNFLVPLTEHFTVDELKAEYGSFANGSCHQEMLNQVKIVHYASKKKPWKFPSEKSGVGWIRAFLRYRSACNDDGTEDAGHAGLCPTGLSNLCVSLTSYPPRIKTVEATIKSIMRQSYSPKTILLWLAREEFPRQEDDLPSSLLALGEHGLSIRWCDNLRSYKKLLPVLAERPDAAIVTADDDLIYPKDWLEQLIASYIQYPNSIHCHRAHRVTLEPSGSFTPYKKWRRQIRDQYLPAYSMLLTGCGGVLYPPGSLHKEVFSEATRSKHFQLVDDIWFWVMAIRNGTKIRVVPDSSFHLNFTPDSQECALWRINDHDGGNDTALDCVRTLFPDVVRRILMEIDGQHST